MNLKSDGPVQPLMREISRLNPMQTAFIESALRDLTADELQALESYLGFCKECGVETPYLAQCYDLIVRDTLREQVYFMRHKRYRYSTYAEVANSVYLNPEYMQKYMHGLALTSYFWPQHVALRRRFMKALPKERSGHYLEIGPGHGVYFMNAMRSSRFDSFEGVDISPKSIELTRKILTSGHFGRFENYNLLCQDFLTEKTSRDQYDAIVMGEVLEHVEQPEAFLRKISSLARPDAFIWITTVINAPAVDHLALFESDAALEKIVAQAGLSVREKLLIPYVGQTVANSLEKRLPMNIGLVLAK